MFDNDRLVCLLENIVKAVDLINSQTSWVKKADDFLLSPEGIFCLSGACMQLIFIGENAKTIDNKTNHKYLNAYSDIPWHDIMGLRNIIVHEYHSVDEEEIFNVIKNDLPTLLNTVQKMIIDAKSSNLNNTINTESIR